MDGHDDVVIHPNIPLAPVRERKPLTPVMEWAVVGGAIASVVLTLVGTILDIGGWLGITAPLLSGIGLASLVVAVSFAHGVRLLPILRPKRRERGRSMEIRQWQNLKWISILLNLLAILSLAVLVFALLIRANALDYNVTNALIVHVPALLTTTIVLTSSAAFLQSLRTPLERDVSPLAFLLHWTSITGAAVTLLWGVLVGVGVLGGTSTEGISPHDHAMMLLACSLFIALDLFIDRSLPTMYILLSEERAVYSGQSHYKQSKSVLAPTLGAFSLLFLVFLLFVSFSGGSKGFIERLRQDNSFIVVLVVIVLALAASGVGAFMLTRSADQLQLFRRDKDKKEVQGKAILYGSIAGALGLGLLAFGTAMGANVLGIPKVRWTDVLSLAMLTAIGPYGFYVSFHARRIRRMEERFPDLLRDLASSHRGGLTLPASVTIAARGDYGPLSDEVQRMADQMSWNVSFREALQRFAERVKTPLVERAVNLILEADRSGGSTTDVLLAAARDARQLKTLENERALSMTLYTIVIYITFGVFLLVAAVLYAQFVPEIVRASQEVGASALESADAPEAASLDQYRAFYHIAALMQGAGNGIIAGMMGSGRALLGLKHSFIMVFMSAFIFSLFLF